MTTKKTLTSIALAGVLTLGTTSCVITKYQHEKPNGEHTHFTATFLDDQNYVEATEADGTKIFYHDRNNDFKLDEVYIEKNRQRTEYKNDTSGKPFLEKHQEQYNIYLKQAIETDSKLKE